MRTINISEEAFEKFCRIKNERKQDKTRAETFDHLIYLYEEQKFRQVKL